MVYLSLFLIPVLAWSIAYAPSFRKLVSYSMMYSSYSGMRLPSPIHLYLIGFGQASSEGAKHFSSLLPAKKVVQVLLFYHGHDFHLIFV